MTKTLTLKPNPLFYLPPTTSVFYTRLLLTQHFSIAQGKVAMTNTMDRCRKKLGGGAGDMSVLLTKETLSALLEIAPDATLVVDKEGKIILVNALAEKLFGYTRQQMYRKTVEMLMPEAHRFSHAQMRQGYIANPQARQMGVGLELKAQRYDGSEFPVEISLNPIQTQNALWVSCAIRDISERKKFQQQLQEAKILAETANCAKSDFIACMSHELRSPLNAILGFAQLLQSSTPTLSASQTDGLEHILQAGWHLLELINDLLDLSMVESGKLTLSLSTIEITPLISDCLEMMMPSAAQKHISLIFKPDATDHHQVKVDLKRLKQVLINLLSNAIKYNVTSGTVRVHITQPSAERIRVSISDTGIGLSPEKLTQLFQPFNRLGQEAGQEKGTGIGLVICKRLIELMGGCMGADSQLEQGSEFWFELPTQAVESEAYSDITL